MKAQYSKNNKQIKTVALVPRIYETIKPTLPLNYRFLSITLGSTLMVSILWLSGCSQKEENDYYVDESSVEEVSQTDISVAELEAVPDNSEKEQIENLTGDTEATLGSKVSTINIEGKELLISANADFKVEDVVKSSNAIESLTQQQGGYIESSKISSDTVDKTTYVFEDKNVTLVTFIRHADIVVRIPKHKVKNFLKQVQNQVKFLNNQEFSAQDVSLDLKREKLKAQLNKQLASELSDERLKSDNEKEQASNVDTIKETFSARQQQQLAELERLNITDRINYSTLQLSFSQPESVYKEVTDNIDSLVAMEEPSFIQQVKFSLINGWDTIKNVVLWLISLWWLAVLALLFYVIYRLIKPVIESLFPTKKRGKKDRVKDKTNPLDGSNND